MLLLSLVLVFGAPVAARAALLGDASISYSAERTVTVNGRSYTGMVFHVPGHERHEQEIQEIPEIVILDAATKQASDRADAEELCRLRLSQRHGRARRP